MNPKTIQRLEKLLETFDSGAVQPEELIQAIDAVMAIVKQSNEAIAKKVGDNDTAIKERIKILENEVDQALRRLEAYSTRLNSDKATKVDVERLQANLASEIKRVSSLIPELPPEFDASDIYTTIEGHKAIIDSISTLIIGENLRNALEALPDGEKLAIEAVEGLREELDRLAKDWRKGGSGGGLGSQIVLDIINQAIVDGTIPSGSLPPGGTTGQVLRKQSSADGDADWETIAGTGIVETIVAGAGISVDSTDPANPIVSATGGGGGGAVDSVNGQTGIVVLDTDDIGEGATNLYYTEARVSANTDVAANSAARHAAATVLDSTSIDMIISGQEISAQREALTGDVTAPKNSNTTTIANDVVTNAKLANMAANTIKGRITGSTGDPEDLTAANVRTITETETTTQLNTRDTNNRNRANHTGTQTASTISDFQSTVSANTDVAANTAARHNAVTVSGTPNYITLVGQDIVRALINLTSHVTGLLPFANLADGSALSVLGRSANTSGVQASIAAASDHQVLRRSGTAIGFGQVALNQANAVTGSLAVGNGGTGRNTSTTAYGLIAAGTTATGAHQTISPGTSGHILKSNGASALPSFSAGAKGDVGLGNVDNTSDVNKPISTATQTALDAKVGYITTTTTSSATPTPTGNAQRNELIVTALAENCTIAAPTGTPAAGNMLKVLITASGGTRTVGYNAALTAGNVTRTTSVPSGKTLVQVYQYQNATWKCHYNDLEA
jgi:hypothetical protein